MRSFGYFSLHFCALGIVVRKRVFVILNGSEGEKELCVWFSNFFYLILLNKGNGKRNLIVLLNSINILLSCVH